MLLAVIFSGHQRMHQFPGIRYACLKKVEAWGWETYKYGHKVLLCKLLWKIHKKKDSLWIKWVNHFYFRDLWSYTTKRDDSTLIKSLINIRNELCARDASMDRVIDRLEGWFQGPNTSLELLYRWLLAPQLHWPWKTVVCKPGIMPKHIFYLWMFSHKKLLTRDRQPYIQDKNVYYVAVLMKHLITCSSSVSKQKTCGSNSNLAGIKQTNEDCSFPTNCFQRYL